jgi:hypothetical protein
MTPASILEQHPDYKATDAIDVLRGTDDATLDVIRRGWRSARRRSISSPAASSGTAVRACKKPYHPKTT